MEAQVQYIQGYNNGYLIAKHEPKLMNSISATLSPSNSYTEGMIHGKQELEFEQVKDQLQEVENLRANSTDRENEFSRD